jgi:hypothetical protein
MALHGISGMMGIMKHPFSAGIVMLLAAGPVLAQPSDWRSEPCSLGRAINQKGQSFWDPRAREAMNTSLRGSGYSDDELALLNAGSPGEEGDHNVESGLYRMPQGMAKTRTPSMPAAMTSWSPVTPTPNPRSTTPCCW